jgi:hypothetical protein
VIFFFGIEIEHGTFEVQRIHPAGCDVRASRTSRARSPVRRADDPLKGAEAAS